MNTLVDSLAAQIYAHLQFIYLKDGWHVLIMPPYEMTEV